MDQWCSRAFCNNAGCASKQCCCFEWGVEQVSWFLRVCAVAEPKAKASYLVERCRVDPAIVAECLLDARVRSRGTEEEQLMDAVGSFATTRSACLQEVPAGSNGVLNWCCSFSCVALLLSPTRKPATWSSGAGLAQRSWQSAGASWLAGSMGRQCFATTP